MNSIIVKRYNKVVNEHKAYEALLPGMILELTSGNAVKKHATAGGNTFPLVALEDELQGRGIGLDMPFKANDRVQVWVPQRGDEGMLLLADGQNVAIGDELASNGLGLVVKHTVKALTSNDAQQATTIYSRPVIAIAKEAKDLTALDGSNSSLESNTQYIHVMFV